jgi:hypothetical protein
MDSAEKLSGAGRSIGAIARRQDKSKTPANPSNATARIAMLIRRIIASPLPSGHIIFRAGLSVKDRKPIDLRRAVKSRMLHGMFLSKVLSEQFE